MTISSMPKKTYYVYIITNKNNTTFYIGITGDLAKRVYEHRNKLKLGFSSKYNINKLVYYETFNSPVDAIRREKQLKNWHREWKLNLIKSINSTFKDLALEWDAETSSA